MKKFISFVVAAAMAVSLVPATAFAKSGEVTATARVINAWEMTKDFDVAGGKGIVDDYGSDSVPELQLRITDADYENTASGDPKLEVTVILDNADFVDASNNVIIAGSATAATYLEGLVKVVKNGSVDTSITVSVDEADVETDEFTFTVEGVLTDDHRISVDLVSKVDNTGAGRKATVSVESDAVDADNLTYVTILDHGISATVRDTVDVAEDEVTNINSRGLKIKSSVGNFATDQEFTLKLNSGFEFSNAAKTVAGEYEIKDVDGREMTVVYLGSGTDDEFTIAGADIEIEAVSAKSGATATITVKAVKSGTVTGSFSATTTVEVAKVVDYKVVLSVDEDEDMPVIYSGTDVDNTGLTDDSDHWSLEVTAEETFPGAWSMRQGFTFSLPEGVYVADVDVTDTDNFVKTTGGTKATATAADWDQAFWDAYQDGDHVNFEFAKRVFDDVNTDLEDDPATVTFRLQLVADPTFEGDVVLKFEGSLVDSQEVTIANFVKPYTVTAQQNDVIIDYRNTSINTPIVVTEAAEGLWDDDNNAAVFNFAVDRGDIVQFEDDATFTIDDDSDLDIDDFTDKNGVLGFKVKDTSDAAATVTISDIELFMNRSIPAGAYELTVSTSMSAAYEAQILFAPDGCGSTYKEMSTVDLSDITDATSGNIVEDSIVGDVCDYDDVVNAAFVNVVTSGRDQDNLFTTKVTVPVGESYLIAGTERVELDVPAYINAEGYTMLPVRAVSKALGINTNNVIWDSATKTVTIMYGQRVITMTVGVKVVTVNGSQVPSSSAPEIVNSRTFLGLRDLATALGVSDISWDPATRTATLN